jgi:ParB family chromosome partitioning protein
VDILEVGQRFQQYEHVKMSKKKGGKVFVAVSHDGAVEIFDGWLSQKEARKLAKAEERGSGEAAKTPRPSTGPVMTQALENYVDLHRHLAVRQALIARPGAAFRLAVAHMAASSGNWSVKRDPQTTRNPVIRASIEASTAQAAFAAEEQAVFALLGWAQEDDADETFIIRHQTADVFAHLASLNDGDVMRIAAFFMARSLQAGSDVVEEVGTRLAVDARAFWQPDDAFFDLIRDRATVNAIVADAAGEAVAKANVAEKAKTQKQIVRDCLAGLNGRAKVTGWLPGWLEFPARGVGQGPSAASEPDCEVEPERMAAE